MYTMKRDQILSIGNNAQLYEYLLRYKDKNIKDFYCYREKDGFIYVANSDKSEKYTIIFVDDMMYDNGDIETIILFTDEGVDFIRNNTRFVYASMYRLEGSAAASDKEELYGIEGSFFFRSVKECENYIHGVLSCLEFCRPIFFNGNAMEKNL